MHLLAFVPLTLQQFEYDDWYFVKASIVPLSVMSILIVLSILS